MSRKTLLWEFWIPVIISLIIIVLYENEILLPGVWGTDKIADYYVAIAMELITICLIPLALRMFKFKKVQASVKKDSEHNYMRWASLRIVMLTLPMMVNAWLYYQFMNVAFGYMGIIGLLCLVFIYPSKTRCNSLS